MAGALLIAALGLRLYGLGVPPMDFHPIRQYHSAMLARAYYLRIGPPVSEAQRSIAEENARREGVLEPPIPEAIAAVAYRLTGGERLWIPRALSAVAWTVGGVFLYLLACSLASAEGGLVALAFYLFLPFSIRASRSFQPDPWMVAAFIGSLFAMWRYLTQPSWRRLLVAALCASIAVLLKPTSAFPIVVAIVPVTFAADRGWLRRVSVLTVFVLASMLPSLVYYSYGLWIAGFLKGQAQMSFLPNLWHEESFWYGWRMILADNLGYVWLGAGLVGAILSRGRAAKAFLLALWVGYLILGLVFPYHIHTHNYYSLPLVPIAALSLAPLGAIVSDLLSRIVKPKLVRMALCGALAVCAFLGSRAALASFFPPAERTPVIAAEIGEAVHHSTRTILLCDYGGFPLRYHGGIVGSVWPTAWELRLQKFQGRPLLSAEQRLDLLIQSGSEYFIVTDYQAFGDQTDLLQLLMKRYPTLARTSDYWIFDLRRRS